MQQKVLDYLVKNDVSYRLISHAAVHHVGEEPPELTGLPTTKNLLLRDGKTDQVYMVVMEGKKRLDIARLAVTLGVAKNRLEFVKYADVLQTVGVEPGHVSIFNLLNDEARELRIVFDEALKAYEEIGFHPNVNTATIFMTPEDTLNVVRRLSHEPLMIPLDIKLEQKHTNEG